MHERQVVILYCMVIQKCTNQIISHHWLVEKTIYVSSVKSVTWCHQYSRKAAVEGNQEASGHRNERKVVSGLFSKIENLIDLLPAGVDTYLSAPLKGPKHCLNRVLH